jgi:hypothetical protein
MIAFSVFPEFHLLRLAHETANYPVSLELCLLKKKIKGEGKESV